MLVASFVCMRPFFDQCWQRGVYLLGRGISFRFLHPSYPAMSDLLDSLLVASVVEESSSDEDLKTEV